MRKFETMNDLYEFCIQAEILFPDLPFDKPLTVVLEDSVYERIGAYDFFGMARNFRVKKDSLHKAELLFEKDIKVLKQEIDSLKTELAKTLADKD